VELASVPEASAFEASRLEAIAARYVLEMLAIVRPHGEADVIGGVAACMATGLGSAF